MSEEKYIARKKWVEEEKEKVPSGMPTIEEERDRVKNELRKILVKRARAEDAAYMKSPVAPRFLQVTGNPTHDSDWIQHVMGMWPEDEDTWHAPARTDKPFLLPPITNTPKEPERCKYHSPRPIERCVLRIPKSATPQIPLGCTRCGANPEGFASVHSRYVDVWRDRIEAQIRRHVQAAVREWPFCPHADAPVRLDFKWKDCLDEAGMAAGDEVIPVFVCTHCEGKS